MHHGYAARPAGRAAYSLARRRRRAQRGELSNVGPTRLDVGDVTNGSGHPGRVGQRDRDVRDARLEGRVTLQTVTVGVQPHAVTDGHSS